MFLIYIWLIDFHLLYKHTLKFSWNCNHQVYLKNVSKKCWVSTAYHLILHHFSTILWSCTVLFPLQFLMFVIKGFRTIVFIFIVISTMFRLICQDNKLPFLDVLVTRTEQGFRSSVYRKPTFTGQYLYFNSHHPYTVKKGTVCCLQHRAKTISSDTDAYQEEMISLRHNLHHNNYLEHVTSAPRN